MAGTILTAGREIADTDKERIALELRSFERKAAVDFLKLLTSMIRDRRTGFARLIVQVNDGELAKVQYQTDFAVSLDTDGG